MTHIKICFTPRLPDKNFTSTEEGQDFVLDSYLGRMKLWLIRMNIMNKSVKCFFKELIEFKEKKIFERYRI